MSKLKKIKSLLHPFTVYVLKIPTYDILLILVVFRSCPVLCLTQEISNTFISLTKHICKNIECCEYIKQIFMTIQCMFQNILPIKYSNYFSFLKSTKHCLYFNLKKISTHVLTNPLCGYSSVHLSVCRFIGVHFCMCLLIVYFISFSVLHQFYL